MIHVLHFVSFFVSFYFIIAMSTFPQLRDTIHNIKEHGRQRRTKQHMDVGSSSNWRGTPRRAVPRTPAPLVVPQILRVEKIVADAMNFIK